MERIQYLMLSYLTSPESESLRGHYRRSQSVNICQNNPNLQSLNKYSVTSVANMICPVRNFCRHTTAYGEWLDLLQS